MGLVSGEVGRGTFVKEALPRGHGVDLPAWSAPTIDLSFNSPSVPGQTELLRAALRQLASVGDVEALLRYQPHGGRAHERRIMAEHLSSRGISASMENTVLVGGAQHGLSVTSMALLEPGDVVAADALTYPGFKLAAETCRIELVAVPAAGRGTDLDARRSCANVVEYERSTPCPRCITRLDGSLPRREVSWLRSPENMG